jgi:hypothetical protein
MIACCSSSRSVSGALSARIPAPDAAGKAEALEAHDPRDGADPAADPVTLFIGEFYLAGNKYYFIMLLVLLECMLPFFLILRDASAAAGGW